ncbi:MAG: hypothetical protein NT051_03535 [Candidatus Micrarchaeota archaeon]|nr:hypothetical protein [Candidatus Micrarchaeota archaeon]
MNAEVKRILIADDSPKDVELTIAALAEKSMYLTKDEKQELGAYSRALGRGDSLGDIAGGINGIEAEARKRERNYARLTELGKKPLRADDRDMLDEFKHRVTHATAQDAFRMKKLDWARLEATLDRLGKGWEAPSVDIDAAIREMLDPKNSECLPEGVLSSLRLVRDRKETFAEDWVEYIVKLRYMEMNESKKQSLLARIGFIIACGLADDRPASQEMEILKSATDAIAKGALPQGEQMALLAKTLEKCESRTEERGQRNFENMMDSGYY